MTTTYAVQFDIRYLDGFLAGLEIPGEICKFPNKASASKYARFLDRVRRDGDFIRAAVTGNRFEVLRVSGVIRL